MEQVEDPSEDLFIRSKSKTIIAHKEEKYV